MTELNNMVSELTRKADKILALLETLISRIEGPDTESWITGAQVLTLLNISKRTLQTFRHQGLLPYSRISGKIYYRVSDVHQLLNTNYKPRLYN